MQIDLTLLYNLFGTIICLLSITMFVIPYQKDKDGIKFNAAKIYLATMFGLTGLSMFAAQFGRGLEYDNFEKLDICMLFFFFLIAQGFLISFLILYTPQYANKTICKRTILPIFLLFGIYFGIILFREDINIYSGREFISRLPHEPLLLFRCFILASIIASVGYNIFVCHRAKREYHKLIANNFSESDFSRSIWLSNLLGCAEALAVWVLLTYFYTTPTLEALVAIFITTVFIFYIKAFYDYQVQHEQFHSIYLLTTQSTTATEAIIGETDTALEKAEDRRCEALLDAWKSRNDKPFTKMGLTITDVAKELSIPKYRISSYINRNQSNFCSWINDLRIQEASRLLIESNTLSISEIAEQIGFCDLPAFSRAFKKVKKISPSEFRNRMGISNRMPLIAPPEPTSAH